MTKLKTFGSFRMNAHPRMKIMAACVGAVLAQWGAGPAFADSGVGVDTALGNALNPPGRSAVPRPLADDGFDTVRHSPSGQLYGVPYDRADEDSIKTAGGWQFSGGAEAGYIGGAADSQSTKFREYKDLKKGVVLNYFEVEGDKPDTANFFQALGGGVGQHDQFYGVQYGRYNDWKVNVFYNETIHVFSDTYKSLFDGVGTGNLSTGLAMPTAVTSGTYATGATNYVGTGSTCSAATPCWSYGGKVYSNAVAVSNINGVLGTYATNGTTLNSATQQANLAAAINAKLAATDNSELALVRKKGGARLDMHLTDNWTAYVSASQEKRTGARPFSINENNISVEIPEPIDYTTSDFLGGLSYVDKLTAFNLRASASLFKNNIGSLSVQYPLMAAATPWGSLQTGTMDLYPDNNAFNLKGEFSRKLPDFYNGTFSAAAAYGTNRQNDSLLMPLNAGVASLPGIAAGAGYNNVVTSGVASAPLNVNNWNGVNGLPLSQATANQRLDTKLFNLGLTLRPTDELSVKGGIRHYETDNKANDGSGHQYTAYNPLTGQYGYIKVDNSLTTVVAGNAVGGNCLAPNGSAALAGSCFFNGPVALTAAQAIAAGMGNYTYPANGPTGVVVYSLARDYKQDNFVLSADYDLGKRASVEASLEREQFKREMRERDKTWEDKFKLGYVNRGFDNATFRASFEDDHRRGGDYNAGVLASVPYYQQVAYGMALPGNGVLTTIQQALASPTVVGYNGVALTNYIARYTAQGMKTDLADRDQNILNARVNFNAREDLDIGLMVQLKQANYPNTLFGAQKDDSSSFNVEVNWQPAIGRQLTAYYSRQDGTKKQTNNSGGGTCPTPGTLDTWLACALAGTATNSKYPTTATWDMTTNDANNLFGLSFQQDLGKNKLAVDYTYAYGKTRISYNPGSTTIVAPDTLALESLLGNAMPNMTTAQNTLTLNLLVPIDKHLSTRLMYRYEDFKVRDWHYDDVIHNAVQNLDGGTLLLDSGPQNYRIHVIGVFVQYKL